jgi:hypothetical protein
MYALRYALLRVGLIFMWLLIVNWFCYRNTAVGFILGPISEIISAESLIAFLCAGSMPNLAGKQICINIGWLNRKLACMQKESGKNIPAYDKILPPI